MTALNWIGLSSVVISWSFMRQGTRFTMSFCCSEGFFLFGLFVMPEAKGVEMGTIAVVSLEKPLLEPSDLQITEL
jgi:hypothetical protein